MSKEIIINDVNVAECRHLSFVEETYCCDCQYEKYAPCQNSDCYYKQLKRLQAENEELKEQLSGKTFFCENCEKLARENEQLKTELKSQQMINLKQQDIAQDYWDALEEIKEIADEETNTDKLLHYKELMHYKNYCAILDIIQEVLK